MDWELSRTFYSQRAEEVIKCIENAKDNVSIVSKDLSLAMTCKIIKMGNNQAFVVPGA